MESKILILGDNVGYYYDTLEVLTEIKKLNAIVIKGNHERMLIETLFRV